jgi:hypothetical protein
MGSVSAEDLALFDIASKLTRGTNVHRLLSCVRSPLFLTLGVRTEYTSYSLD